LHGDPVGCLQFRVLLQCRLDLLRDLVIPRTAARAAALALLDRGAAPECDRRYEGQGRQGVPERVLHVSPHPLRFRCRDRPRAEPRIRVCGEGTWENISLTV